MNLFRLFLAHEWTTQWRSMRFRGLAAVYVLAASAPGVAVALASGRTTHIFGPAAYNELLLAGQPLLTALFAVGLAVDAISRERDEGSFAVLSVAPISSAGYVLRRWLALLVICAATSLVPTMVTAALAIRTRQALPLLSLFAGGWLLFVLPALLVSSALAIALGAIAGRTVLAVIAGAVLITAGIGIPNLLFFYMHINFDGPGDLFAGGGRGIQELIWMVRGFWIPHLPSDAAYPLRSEARALPARAGVTAAMAIVLLALSAFYLRRTRRDLRPWHISATHQLRTLLKTVNRVREEYAPDSGSSTADRAALATGLLLAALLVGALVRRQEAFAALGAARFAAESSPGVPTSTSVIMDSARVDASIALDGALRSRVTSLLRNGGARPESHLSFMLNPMVAVRRLAASRGRARAHRAWERLDVELDPPLGPGERRALSFDLDGTPGDIDFALQPPGDFRARWNRYAHAKEAIYLTDLSRSRLTPAATEVRMRLRGSGLAPVLRYTAWTLKPPQQGDGFLDESIAPPAPVEVHLAHPYPLAVDACGTVSTTREIDGRCAIGLASYAIFGGPFAQRALGDGAMLAYIPAHERMAASQAQSLASSIRIAAAAWPHLALPPHLVFIERPIEPDEQFWWFEYQPWRLVEQIGARGSVFLVPEASFATTKPIDANAFAASIVAGTLRARRRVVPDQADFFSRFYTAAAVARLGMRKAKAVEPASGVPETAPLLNAYFRPISRMARVLAAIEYRAGSEHFVDGINDFVAGGDRPGTAKELVDAIGRRAGIDLSRAYDDYFAGSALPELTLTGVAFRRDGARWSVTGAVKNNATGEAFVPVALRTSQGSLWQTVRVESGGSTPFAFAVTGEPHAVQLDPDRVCYRHAMVGLVENVEYRGEP